MPTPTDTIHTELVHCGATPDVAHRITTDITGRLVADLTGQYMDPATIHRPPDTPDVPDPAAAMTITIALTQITRAATGLTAPDIDLPLRYAAEAVRLAAGSH